MTTEPQEQKYFPVSVLTDGGAELDRAEATELLTDGVHIYDASRANMSDTQIVENNRILSAGGPYLTQGSPLRLVSAFIPGYIHLPIAPMRARAVVLAQAIEAFELDQERRRTREAHKSAVDHLRKMMLKCVSVSAPEHMMIPAARDYKLNDHTAANIVRVEHEGIVFTAGNGHTGGLLAMPATLYFKHDPGATIEGNRWQHIESLSALGKMLLASQKEDQLG